MTKEVLRIIEKSHGYYVIEAFSIEYALQQKRLKYTTAPNEICAKKN